MLKDELRGVIGDKKKFLLCRIAGLSSDATQDLLNIKKNTREDWIRKDLLFRSLYHKVEALADEHRIEAFQLLRKDNQLLAILFEKAVIIKMGSEIESGEYELVKTNLGREVYGRLVSGEIEAPKQEEGGSVWEEVLIAARKIRQVKTPEHKQIEEAPFKEITAEEVINAEEN